MNDRLLVCVVVGVGKLACLESVGKSEILVALLWVPTSRKRVSNTGGAKEAALVPAKTLLELPTAFMTQKFGINKDEDKE